MDVPEPGPRVSRHLWSATETRLCSGVGVPGLRREELITGPTLDPLVPKDPRGGAWSGRGETGATPVPDTSGQRRAPRGGRQRPPTAVFTQAHLKKKTRNNKKAFSTYLPKASPPFF